VNQHEIVAGSVAFGEGDHSCHNNQPRRSNAE
jgi:hypothetical protein